MAVSHHSLISSIAAYHCTPYNYVNPPVSKNSDSLLLWHTLSFYGTCCMPSSDPLHTVKTELCLLALTIHTVYDIYLIKSLVSKLFTTTTEIVFWGFSLPITSACVQITLYLDQHKNTLKTITTEYTISHDNIFSLQQ